MSISLRPYAPADAAACTRIFDAAWHAGHPYAPRRIDCAAFQRETLGENIVVAEAAGIGVLGFVSLYAPRSFIHHLYVRPDCHGRGVGRMLLQHAVALMGGKASLKCQTRNEGALAFYRSLGWQPGEEGDGENGPWVRLHSP